MRPQQEQDAWDALERSARFWEGAYRNERAKNGDLQRHLRDRDAHIANLEAMLKPHLLAEDEGEQEALL